MLERINRRLSLTMNLLSSSCTIGYYNTWIRWKQKRVFAKNIHSCISPKHLTTHNSTEERQVEQLTVDHLLSEVIVTCYFTGKPDPQTGIKRNTAEFSFIEPWYSSLVSLQLNGIILHDGLEDSFIERYQTDKIQFRKCKLGDYSIFEERWVLYHLFLQQLTSLKKVVFTDSNDVFIRKSPFEFVDSPSRLYIGRDNANRIKDSGWLKEEMDTYIFESGTVLPRSYHFQWVYNAGVVAGHYTLMFFLTAKMVERIFAAHSNYHKDMSILNLVIHCYFHPKLSGYKLDRRLVNTTDDAFASCSRICTGFPFNSGFKDYDMTADAYFIHK